MAKVVYIAEKPQAAQALAEVFGISHKTKHFYKCTDGETYVTWLLGHVLEMVDAKDYDPKYSQWLLEDLPIIPAEFKMRPSADRIVGGKVVDNNEYKRVQLAAVVELMMSADEVCIATDPDEEGELLGVEVIEEYKPKCLVTRILPTSLDVHSLKAVLAKKAPIENTRTSYESGLTRSRVDWVVGINVTRALTAYNRNKIESPLHSGRVQTFINGELYRNEQLRKNFVAKPIYKVEAKATVDDQVVVFKLSPSPEAAAILDEKNDPYDAPRALAYVEDLALSLNGKDGEITKSDKTRKKTSPPLGYKLSDIQIECSKKFGYSASDTLAHIQSMYDSKIISYPRTDCSYMPEEQHGWASVIVENLKNTLPELVLSEQIDLSRKSKSWNDKKIGNHHAIIPTQKIAELGKLKPEERNVYELIAKKYLMQFMPDYEYDHVEMSLSIEDQLFTSSGKTPVVTGWKVLQGKEDVSESSDEDDQFLPQIEKGAIAKSVKVLKKESKTSKPKPYNEASLLAALENAYRLVDDKVLRDNMKKRGKGIGTQATTAGHLSELKRKGIYTIQKKAFELTDKGRMMAQIAPTMLTDVAMTAELEYQFHLIKNGDVKFQDVLDKYNQLVGNIIEDVRLGKCELPSTLVKSFPCKKCGGDCVQRVSRKNKKKFWICIGECKSMYTDHYGKPDQLIITEKQECPKCKKPSLIRFESKKVKGFFSWFCTDEDCKRTFPDKNGQVDPVVRSCKECGLDLSKIVSSKNGRVYWICPDKVNSHIFPDKDGEPNFDFKPPKVMEQKCLGCGGSLVQRNGSNGIFYGCTNWNKKGVECKLTYRDDNGSPVMELQEVHKCPSCGGRLMRRNGSKGPFYGCSNWNKKGAECKATFQEENGKPKLT